MSTCGRTVGLCTAVNPRTTKAPAPDGGEGLRYRVLRQRQRMDMTRPTTMAPNPIPKFHGPRVTMNGMRSPAT
jgi:hypothetical protein